MSAKKSDPRPGPASSGEVEGRSLRPAGVEVGSLFSSMGGIVCEFLLVSLLMLFGMEF